MCSDGTSPSRIPTSERNRRGRRRARSSPPRSRRCAADFRDKVPTNQRDAPMGEKTPSAPATRVSRSVSARNCRVSCQREAPSAARSAISFRRDVALTRSKIRDIRAGDDEEQSDGAAEDPEQSAHVFHHSLAQRGKAEAARRRSGCRIDASIAARSRPLPPAPARSKRHRAVAPPRSSYARCARESAG